MRKIVKTRKNFAVAERSYASRASWGGFCESRTSVVSSHDSRAILGWPYESQALWWAYESQALWWAYESRASWGGHNVKFCKAV